MAKKPVEARSVAPVMPEGYEEENISFPPYWTPEVGKAFHAMPVDIDLSDEEFPRIVLQNVGADLDCSQGSKDEQVKQVIKAGEHFTISKYAGLPLEKYMGYDCAVTVTGQRDVGQAKPMYVFALGVSKDAKLALTAERKERGLLAAARWKETRKQLSANNAHSAS